MARSFTIPVMLGLTPKQFQTDKYTNRRNLTPNISTLTPRARGLLNASNIIASPFTGTQVNVQRPGLVRGIFRNRNKLPLGPSYIPYHHDIS